MARKIIDISVALKAGIASDPPRMLPEIEYHDHHMTAPAMAQEFGIAIDQLPEGEYAAVERVHISTHNGTHLDAPYHFFSRMNERTVPGGEPSWRIDEVPLDWCFQPGVKLDFRHFPSGYVVTARDVETELERIGHTLLPLEIVEAARELAQQAVDGKIKPNRITEAQFAKHLHRADIPDVDLFIRTSGEQRASNFLLWQAAYAEYVFQDKLWPDYDRRDLWAACEEYVNRNRRFGRA